MDSDFLDPGKQAITGGTLGPKSGSLKIGVGNYPAGTGNVAADSVDPELASCLAESQNWSMGTMQRHEVNELLTMHAWAVEMRRTFTCRMAALEVV